MLHLWICGVTRHATIKKVQATRSINVRHEQKLLTNSNTTINNPLSDDFGSVPQGSETFGTISNDSEPFRTIRNPAEKTESHTLTVREVARLFEHAGVSRTERSIINWCRANRQGVARLDAFCDENERRYYITAQSVTRAIEEERAKQPPVGSPHTGWTTDGESVSSGKLARTREVAIVDY